MENHEMEIVMELSDTKLQKPTKKPSRKRFKNRVLSKTMQCLPKATSTKFSNKKLYRANLIRKALKIFTSQIYDTYWKYGDNFVTL